MKKKENFHEKKSVSPKKKHLGINLTKEVKNLHAESYKIFLKKDSKKLKNSPCSWIERTLLKWQYYPEQSTDLMWSLSNYPPMTFFHRSKIIQKFMWNHRPTIARAIFGAGGGGGRKSGSMTLPDFRQYYKATVNKTVCTWYKNRHANEWNSIESPEINLYI